MWGGYLNLLLVTAQMIHCIITLEGPCSAFFCSFIYGFNDRSEREILWRDLKGVNTSEAWVIMGDFNSVLNLDERMGFLVRLYEVQPFRECVTYCGLVDIKSSGRMFTWTNKQEGECRVFSTIDRVMANMKWLHLFENAVVAFLPEGEFEHCPGVVCMYPGEHNMWVQSNHFMDVVKRSWERNVQGVFNV